jgi:glutathione S-transferase
MAEPATTIIGSPLSPYVRKVLVCLGLKGVPYALDPIVPFYGNDEFSRLSPLRRIPVLMDERITVADSTVICEYLDERHPEPALRPRSPAARARSRWLEEYADTRLGEVFIWRYFNQMVIRRAVWKERPDEAVVERAREVEIPQILDYLEGEVPQQGFLFGGIGIADIAIAAFFRNLAFARYTVDAARWPVTAAFVARALDHPAFAKLRPLEDLLLRTPPERARQALTEAGVAPSGRTFGTATPRRGVMSL